MFAPSNSDSQFTAPAAGTSTALIAAPGSPGSVGTINNDVFVASTAESAVDGGGGHDVIDFAGTSAQETIVNDKNGQITVTDSVANRDGSHTLSNIQYLLFADKLVFVEDADNANVARLYAAAFNRQPDVTGLNFWTDVYANNVSPSAKIDTSAVTGLALAVPQGATTSIAQSFITSAEFQNLYGTLSNAAFLTQLYANVLGRTPDAGGLAYWEGVLNATGPAGRAAVLVNFAEGTENAGKVDFAQHPDSGWLFPV